MRNTITVLSIVFFLFTSCDPFTYYNIPDDEKSVLVNNDTILFKNSQNSDKDTFQMKIFESYEMNDGVYYEQHSITKYLIQNKITYFKEIRYFQFIGSSSVSIDRYHFSQTIYKKLTNNLIGDLSVLGLKYTDVFAIHETNIPDSIPSTVYYTFKNGIIRYDYADGRKYELMSETVAKK